ncbi:MAG: hemerythrin domain-containing protein [Bacteroidales bacterium]|nr:hemerythrin domain-containing protein [Bacteroidales bacterium]
MLFTKKMKLADLVITNHSLVLILQRFNIELGFGEKSVADVCQQYGISEDFFLMICNVYTNDQYLPTPEELSSTDMSQLIPYLTASHAYYLLERIPHIENHLNRIADACQPTHRDTLLKFFKEYRQEVANHFQYEEVTVFPYIKQLHQKKQTSGYSIEQFEQNHSNIEDKLGDLTNIILKYLPGNIMPNERRSLLFDIFQLSTDLNTHSLIEEKILIPYVQTLEQKL